jgi:hypothetical protein
MSPSTLASPSLAWTLFERAAYDSQTNANLVIRHAELAGHKSRLFPPDRVVRRCMARHAASSCLARRKNPSISTLLIQRDGLLTRRSGKMQEPFFSWHPYVLPSPSAQVSSKRF